MGQMPEPQHNAPPVSVPVSQKRRLFVIKCEKFQSGSSIALIDTAFFLSIILINPETFTED